MDTLIINFLLYFIYTLIAYVKERNVTMHFLVSVWFTLVALMGCIVVQVGYYQLIYGTVLKLPLVPYVIAFISFMVLMWPLRVLGKAKFDMHFLETINKKQIKKTINILLLIFIPYFLVLLKASLTVGSLGKEAYDSIHFDGISTYSYSGIETKIIWICGQTYHTSYPLVLAIATIELLNKKIKRNLFIIGFILIITFLDNIVNGARGGLFFFCISFLFFILPFYSQFSKKIKKYFINGGLIIVGIFLIYSISMTISRAEDSSSETATSSIIRYLGEPFPNLGHEYWNKVLNNPMGLRMFPFLFPDNNLSNIANKALGEQHRIWGAITGVPILNYKTIYGDFYVEFGTSIGFLIIVLYTLILRIFVRKKLISLASMPILMYYLEMYAYAPMLFSKRDYYNFLMLIECIILYIIITFYSKRKISK